MYKYSCYTENTKEAREYSFKIGKKTTGHPWKDTDRYIISTQNTIYSISEQELSDLLAVGANLVDCTNNLPLFKALTAVRDDSDKDQYFMAHCYLVFSDEESAFAGDLFLCKESDARNLKFDYMGLITDGVFFHKAIDKELIEQFKKI